MITLYEKQILPYSMHAGRIYYYRIMRQDLSRVVSAKMIFSKNSKCDFVTESASETGYTTNTKHKEAFL